MSATAVVESGNNTAYQKKLADLLGSRDPLEVLAQTPGVMSKFAREEPDAVLSKRPFVGKWTPKEIIGHLLDTEWLYGYRIRLILCEDRPKILSMDQELWVTGQRYNQRDAKELAESFGHLRAENLRLWKAMKPTDLDRVGSHTERGDESLGLMLKMNAGHDLSHIDQITRYIAAAKKQ